MAGDWIKLHRKLLDNPVFEHEGMFRLWVYCLLRAAWKDGTCLIPGMTKRIAVPRGAFVTGRESLHRELYGKSKKKVGQPVSKTLWRWLESLEELGCVSVRNVSNRCSLVSICNYDTYQATDIKECPAGVQPVSSSRPAGVQPVSTVEELNNQRTKEPPPLPPPAAVAVITWNTVVAELFNLGVVAAQDAVETAQGNGCTPEELMGIIAHYIRHDGAWGEGALHNRVKTAQPGTAPEVLWPPKSPEYTKAERQRADDQKRANEAAARQQEEQTAANRKAEEDRIRETRETTFKPILDALEPDKLTHLAEIVFRDNKILLKQFRSEGIGNYSVKRGLLIALERQHLTTTETDLARDTCKTCSTGATS